MPHLPLMYGYVILPGLALFIVSLLLLIKAVNRNNRLQILLFTISLLTVTFSVYYKLYMGNALSEIGKTNLKSYNDLKKGDTTTIEGIVVDRKEKISGIKDSTKNIFLIEKFETGNRKFINQHTVSILKTVHDSIRIWMDYDHQMKENLSYRMKIKAIKTDNQLLKWRLIYIIKVDTLYQPPFIRR